MIFSLLREHRPKSNVHIAFSRPKVDALGEGWKSHWKYVFIIQAHGQNFAGTNVRENLFSAILQNYLRIFTSRYGIWSNTVLYRLWNCEWRQNMWECKIRSDNDFMSYSERCHLFWDSRNFWKRFLLVFRVKISILFTLSSHIRQKIGTLSSICLQKVLTTCSNMVHNGTIELGVHFFHV